ncbi:MAG: CBS domain-containing protein [Magnetococcales bacterium]|nr:CBS domain-containing protein [Magnetococcales bacterium]
METPDKIIKKTRPFFLNFFGRLSTDLNTLTAAPVTVNLTDVELLRGEDDLESSFEKDRCVAYVREDGLNTGDVHLIFDVATSIALTGLMMMMGEGVIQNQVKTREYNEEIEEGFNEVSNQIVGAFNDLIEKKMPNGGHLFLENTARFEYGDLPTTFKETTTYLTANAEIQVSNFPQETCRILVSKGLADELLGVTIEGTPEEEAEIAARKAEQSGGEEANSEEVADSLKDALGDTASGSDGATGGAGGSGADGTAGGAAGADGTGGGAAGGAGSAGSGAGGDFDDDGTELESGGLLDQAGGNLNYSTSDGLPVPDEPGSIKVVMTEPPFSLKEDEKIMTAINAMRHDGFRYIGVESKGKLIRVVSHSDLRQVMGPFFGTKAMGPRDKAICTLAFGKLNEGQQLIRIPLSGSINQAADLLAEFNLRCLPVVSDKGVLRGFIPVHSVMSYFRKKKNA